MSSRRPKKSLCSSEASLGSSILWLQSKAEARELAITQLYASETKVQVLGERRRQGRVSAKIRYLSLTSQGLRGGWRVQNQGPAAEQFQVQRVAQPGLLAGCKCEGASTMQCSVRTRADAVGGARPKSILPGTTEGGIPESINPATRFAPCSRTLYARSLSRTERTSAPQPQQKVFAWRARRESTTLEDAPCSIAPFRPFNEPLDVEKLMHTYNFSLSPNVNGLL